MKFCTSQDKMCVNLLFISLLSRIMKHLKLYFCKDLGTAAPTTPTLKLPIHKETPSPGSRVFGLLSLCCIYLTFIEYTICCARNFKNHLTPLVSNSNFPHCPPNVAQYHLQVLWIQLNHKSQLYQ